MEKVLNQEEIDAMFRAAHGGPASGAAPAQAKHTPWDLRQAGQIKKEQARAISMLHEGFARNLTHSLGAYLRVVFETNVVSVEQLTFCEFLSRIPDLAYLASFTVNPMNVPAAIEMDLSLAFPIIDLLLGGSGGSEQAPREITGIEEQILEGVMKILCRELETAWQSLGLKFESGQRLQPSQMQRLMPPNEKTLGLSFEVTMPASRGMLNVVFPAVVSNALLRMLARDLAYQKPRGSATAGSRLRTRIRECPFVVELSVPSIPATTRQLLNLSPGDLLPLRHSIRQLPRLMVTGHELFEAIPARRDLARAGQVVRRLDAQPEMAGG